MKRICDFLGGVPMTLIGGIFVIISFVLSRLGIQLVIDPAWVTVIICGVPLLYLSIWRLIYNKGISKISSALLICIAMIAAIMIGDLFAAGEVAFIMAIGAILEDRTTERAKKGLKNLISLTPVQARRIINGNEEMVKTEEIKVDDILRVLPGETIPVDAVIVSGNTSVDQSIMTGESLPVDKEIGDNVFCGTLNCFGAVDIKATQVGEDSSLQKLIHMVQEAENKKAPMARIADVCASWLVPVALLIAVLAYFFTGNIIRAVTVLVVFCPCALVLATPTAIMAAIGQATKHGVIIKSGEALENMGKVDTITFDKTGTLTLGKLEVSDIVVFSKRLTDDMLLSLAASAETRSEHPLGKAIVEYAKKQNIEFKNVSDFSMESGKGIYAVVNQYQLLCGNEKYLQENSIIIPEKIVDTIEIFRNEGKASILVAINNVCEGIITLSDILRPTAGEIVKSLKTMSTDVVLLTGDNEKTADYFARQVGIKTIKADLLPADKVDSIIQLQKDGKTICMIGDGVNDAPALKTANVGIAMGGMGSDIAVDASDIILMSDDISRIPYLKRLSNATVKTIKFSISLSLVINFIAIVLSLQGLLTPTTGALVHNAGSVLVVMIAALLYDRKFE
ncbi:copper-translocating P-type ATPase [Clostridioides difficile]|nr:copper-translocating P-type ATPase [Clostridioides difficile]